MDTWGIRVRSRGEEYFVVLVAVAIVVVLLGGWLTVTTHITPATVTEPEVQGSWQSTAEYQHQATVTASNPVYPTGTTLEDRSRYYTTLSPVLDGIFRYSFDAREGQLAVEARTDLVVQSVDDGEGADVLWRYEDHLDNTAATIAPGETVEVPFSVNVSDVLSEVAAIEQDIGSSPGETEVFVRTTFTTNGVAADGDVQQQSVYNLSITGAGDTYAVSGDGGTERHEHFEPVTRDVEYGLLRSLLGPLLLLLGLGGGVGLGIARNEAWLQVSEAERTKMTFADERDEFDDWISTGTVSNEAIDRPPIEIETLEELVDVAVDTDERVIEDHQRQRYYVLDEAFCYEYVPPEGIDLNELPGTD